MHLNDRELFYINGFMKIEIEKQSSMNRIIEILKDIKSSKIKENYFLKEKYPGTLDLRPSVYDYDNCFLNFLEENNIIDRLKKLTGASYLPYHVQIRYSTQSSNRSNVSYMDWHRDAYIMNDKILGRFPPPIKLMIYPSLSDDEDDMPRLKIIPNSHIIQMHGDQQYYSEYGAPINNIDRQLIRTMNQHVITTSNSSFTLFNTAMLHGASRNNNQKEFRVIYSLILEEQFEDVKDDLHLNTRDTYLSNLKNG